MKTLVTIRYELFHYVADLAHADDFVNVASLVHDGYDFIVYEDFYYYKNKMEAEEWDKLMDRIETASKSPLCHIDHNNVLNNVFECTTYAINVYSED